MAFPRMLSRFIVTSSDIISTSARTYNDAIEALNSLQSSHAAIRASRDSGYWQDATRTNEINTFLRRIGHTPQDLNRLNVVHVAGTKGKGSTCAYVDSILRNYQKAHGIPRKTGMLTSPHLIAVRERIRINASPISKELFAKYFFEVWDRLESAGPPAAAAPPERPVLHSNPSPREASARLSEPPARSKPSYARFLTLLAIHVFLQESVTCAVLETGLGGAFDPTNLVPRPVVTGITMLGLDHVSVLGDTVERIAWHKAGIMKPGTPTFASPPASASVAAMLKERARELGCAHLAFVPVDPRLTSVRIRPDAEFQRLNASLAVALAEEALTRAVSLESNGEKEFRPAQGQLTREIVDGLESMVWRGRCEVKEEGRVVYHLDGAHTVDSLHVAAEWFAGECAKRSGPKVLIFNQQTREEAGGFLQGLYEIVKASPGGSFQHVIFCTNRTYAETGYRKDLENRSDDHKAIENLTVQKAFADTWTALDPPANVFTMSSIEKAIDRAKELEESLEGDGQTVQVLITGSLHLVGGALALLEKADAI